jgi:hypothetical protein
MLSELVMDSEVDYWGNMTAQVSGMSVLDRASHGIDSDSSKAGNDVKKPASDGDDDDNYDYDPASSLDLYCKDLPPEEGEWRMISADSLEASKMDKMQSGKSVSKTPKPDSPVGRPSQIQGGKSVPPNNRASVSASTSAGVYGNITDPLKRALAKRVKVTVAPLRANEVKVVAEEHKTVYADLARRTHVSRESERCALQELGNVTDDTGVDGIGSEQAKEGGHYLHAVWHASQGMRADRDSIGDVQKDDVADDAERYRGSSSGALEGCMIEVSHAT